MPEGGYQEKTEKATPKRRAEARKKGQVAQSRDISSVAVLFCALGFFFITGSWMFWRLSDVMRGIFQNIGTLDLQGSSAQAFFLEISEKVFEVLMPLMLIILIAGIAANVLQFGFMFTVESLSFKLSKLNPVSGIKRLFSLKSLVELLKSLFKIVVVAGIAYLTMKGEIENIPSLINISVGEILSYLGEISFKICFFTCLALVFLAALDYAYQRWEYEKQLKMTKQEVRDELKQTEGDPAIKARIRNVQREMAQRRMMEEVPGADVVITNPTSLAIALKYDTQIMMAPRVVAKGAGVIAENIKKIAEENSIPIVEDKPLAQTLFKAVEIGEYIPVELYRAVAEILAYVYRLKGTLKKQEKSAGWRMDQSNDAVGV